MESMSRATWTDERLDDFARNTDRRFDEVDRRFDEVDRRFDQVDRRFDRVEGELRELRSGFTRVDTRIDDLHRGMLQVGGGMIATFVIGFAGLILTRV
ncbi:MAG TPA: hypothetical protein VF176_05950 [Solirubrobacterales bacterium]